MGVISAKLNIEISKLFDGTQKLSASYVLPVYLWNKKGKHVDRETAGSNKHFRIFYVSILELNICIGTQEICARNILKCAVLISGCDFSDSHTG